jgi:hypothetical protein
MKNYISVLLLLIAEINFAQTDSLKKISFSGYGELYFGYDFSNPANHERPGFLYNHKRHNEINANILMAKAAYSDKRMRTNAGLMAGNYAQYNLSAEPIWVQFVYEANAGVKISSEKNIWVDAGIFPSHIGFESAIGADCPTLTRSLLAENSPYYETGAKISYTSDDEKLFLSGLYLNGWQRVKKPDFIQKPSFGLQATYKPAANFTINYSNFTGTDKPDSVESLRHYHNFYFQYDPTARFGLIAGFDIGFEKTYDNSYKNWYSPVIIVKQKIDKNTIIALRGEYYDDSNEIIISTGTPAGFRTFGFSSNIDIALNDKLKWRTEAKIYQSKDKIFDENTKNNNYLLTTALTIKL